MNQIGKTVKEHDCRHHLVSRESDWIQICASIFYPLSKMEVPTDVGLKMLFEQKKLSGLVSELEDGTTTFEQFRNRSETQWKEFYGLAGVDIFNYLHPKCIFN